MRTAACAVVIGPGEERERVMVGRTAMSIRSIRRYRASSGAVNAEFTPRRERHQRVRQWYRFDTSLLDRRALRSRYRLASDRDDPGCPTMRYGRQE